jgi:extracellular elastinolytic metalloproteinase
MRRLCVPLRRTRALRATLLVALAVAALTLVPSSFGIVQIDSRSADRLPDFDARAEVKPTSAQLTSARSLRARVSWNSFGTPASIFKDGGYLATAVKAPTAAAAARSWIASHASLFRLRSAATLQVDTAAPLRGAPDVHAVTFRQTFGGVLSADGLATVTVVRSHGAWNVVYASSSLTPDLGLTGRRVLTPTAAWAKAAGAAGDSISRTQVTPFGKLSDGTTQVIATGFSGMQTVRAVAFGTPRLGALRAYDTTVTKTTDGAQSSYRVIVDAATGRLLLRQNLVDQLADDPVWSAFPIAPPYDNINAFPWNYPSTDTRQVYCWTETAGCATVVSDNPATTVYPLGVASKFQWDVPLDVNGVQSTPQSTVGNNVDEALLWSGGGRSYNSPSNPRPISASRDYTAASFPFTNQWFTSRCDPAPLIATGQAGAQANPNVEDWSAATINLFVGHNRLHDYTYYLGWDEGHWNAQQYNNGVTMVDASPIPGGPTATPVGNDAIMGQSQDGAVSGGPPRYGSRDNANMGTGADGLHPSTNMFLWQPLPGAFYAPCVDGDYDVTVFAHEFGHAVENRLEGKGVGGRQGFPAGAMGEAFGDMNALEFVNESHVAPVPGSDRYTEGAYVTGNGYNGIRDFLAGRPMGGEFPTPGHNPDTDPLNYGDIGFDNVGPEVHADGEMWVALQIDLRDLFLQRYPSSSAAEDIACVRGQQSSNTCPGDRRWMQDYFDAMIMMSRNATMQDARDAMLAADVARFGGANQDLLWQGFAMRGLGQFAQTNPNVGTSGQASAADTDPTPDFSSPLANNATLNFFADAKGGSTLPVNAKIYVGDYQARAVQVADTDPTTNPDGTPRTVNLDNTAQFTPNGTGSLTGKNPRWTYYNFTAVAPGYGFVRFRVKNLQAGETRDITIHFATNYASTSQSATITGDSLGTNTNLQNVLDDDEATNDGQTDASAQGRWFVVHLGNVGPTGSVVKRLGVSALLVPGNNRFTALRSFEAYICRAGKIAANPTCDGSIDAGWTKLLSSPADAFPSVNPRPVAPDMTLRYFDADRPTVGTDVKFVVTNNQCTGQTSYQGDQDNDPNINSDCRATQGPNAIGFSPRDTEVHVAEVEVFGQNPTVDGTLVSTAG